MSRPFTPNPYRTEYRDGFVVGFIGTASGHEIIIDDWAYDLVRDYRWFAQPNFNTYYGIATPTENGVQRTVYIHQLLCGFPPKGLVVDHEDWNGLNNRFSNLEPVTHSENSQNKRPRLNFVTTNFQRLSV